MSGFLQHVRFGLRLIHKSPVFYLVIVLVLALGIGANTAVFSVVDAVLLRKLPYREPDRLVMLWEKNPTLGALVGDRVPSAYVNYEEWARQAHSFEGMAAFEDVSLNRTGLGEPERIAGARVSTNLFQVLGVDLAQGSGFANSGDGTSGERMAILSDGYWKSHYGANSSAVGQALTLNDMSYVVAGVLPETFHLPSTREGGEQRKPDIYIPYEPAGQRSQPELNRLKLQVFARLKPGVSLQDGRNEMDVIGRRLEEQNPALNAGFGVNVFPVYVEDVGRELRRNLLVLLAAVGFILLLACANLANMLLTRAMARQRELAIRKALGASRGRLIAQLLVEGLLLGVFGGLLAILFAHFGIKLLLALKPADLQRPEQVHLNLTVLLFTLAVSVVAGLVCSVVPAIYVSKTEINSVLKQSGTSQRNPGRVRSALVVTEVALAFVLMIAAVFMIGSLVSVLKVDPGFRADHVLTMHFSMPASRYATNDQFAGFCRQVLERVRALPGVKSASFSDGLPMTRIRMMKFIVDGAAQPKRGSEPTADMRGISSQQYLETLGIPLVTGRNFTVDELDKNQPVIVINQTLAKKLWPKEEAVGKHIRTVARPGTESLDLTVIGVAGDTHQVSLESGVRPEVLRPMVDYTQLTLSVRTSGDPAALTSSVKAVVFGLDKNLPVYDVQTMQEVVEENLGQRRFDSFLMGAFGGLALMLVAIGIYGVLTSTVEQRTPEIGVRMALGARRGDVLRMVMAHGMRLAVIGMAIGLVVGFAVTRLLASLFFGVSPSNPLAYLAVCAGMAAIAAVACYLPAQTAVRVDPVRALRAE